jgi:hypothetical protein
MSGGDAAEGVSARTTEDDRRIERPQIGMWLNSIGARAAEND